ncbi:lytic murein transglycosylase [Taklimakanibacter deserti]|uniref:lytic murein transglycosylase n=1 Tax=Taklimakanibacter deserti TaxID=2267839 RepID=UPI0013C4A67D
MRRPWKIGALLVGTALFCAATVSLYMSDRGSFIAKLWTDSQSRNISTWELLALAFGFDSDPDVLKRARNQPEVVMPVKDYVEKRVSPARIEAGKLKITEWQDAVAGIEKKYGVPARMLVAIWGIESNFGKTMGDKNVLGSLATLTKAGYRADYFNKELLAALEIARDGKIQKAQMVGSWAGAMGQIQFMPSSYLTYAVDHDGDGRKDIWKSIPDALASTANYLKESGWRPDTDWGYEVKIPEKFDFAAAWKKKNVTLADWAKMGLQRADGKPFPRPSEKARFYLPAGGAGPVFLVLKNFDVIKRYNNADSYALAVAHLADRIAGAEDFISPWPEDVVPLSRSERKELEALIAEKVLKPGKPAGNASHAIRLAIIKFQKTEGLLADGHPSRALLQRLRDWSPASSS